MPDYNSTYTGAQIDAAIAKAQTAQQPPGEGAFVDGDKTKLDGIEASATTDQTGSEIKSLYEGEANTNAFTDAEKTKLGAIEGGATADQTAAEIKALYEGEADTNAFTDAEKAKVGHISVTQAVDLDDIETRVNDLDASIVLKGVWDASAGTFPGSGSAQAGSSYIVSVAGTVDGEAFAVNDRIVAIADDASTSTFSANWHKLDYTDEVLSVAGRTGAIVLTQADIADLTADLAALSADRNKGTAVHVATGTALTVTIGQYSQIEFTPTGTYTITVDPGSGNLEESTVIKVINTGGHSGTWVGDTGKTLNLPNKTQPAAPATGETDAYVARKVSSAEADLFVAAVNLGPAP